ncbi:MAG: AAA family ATPase [Veillonellaceae bacterium]|jgi:DNA-binding winged helix-turn-helix (wHTH) protein|nr:AAA family ATPase [Veillonellaceae bacterium]
MADLNFPNAISDENDFFGRRDAITEIEEVLYEKRRVPVLIIGERRIGKTSLQNVVVRRLLAFEDPGFIPLVVEPRGINSFSQFAQAIVQRLANVHAIGQLNAPGTTNLPAQIDSTEQLETILTRVAQQTSRPLVICVDEFDEIVRTAQEELPRLIGMIYYLVEKTDLPVFFLFTMTSIPVELQQEIPSTLVSISSLVEIKPFRAEEMQKMALAVSEGKLIWSPDTLQTLYHFSGGHPYLTKLILAYLLQQSQSTDCPLVVDENSINKAIEQAIIDPRAEHVISNLYHVHFNNEEKEIVLFLAEKGSAIAAEDLRNAGKAWLTAAKRLSRRNYLDSTDESFDFHIVFLGIWLRNWLEFDEECERHSQLRKSIIIRPEIEVNELSKLVLVKGKQIQLSSQEYSIMHCLASRAEQVVSREILVDQVWGTSEVTDQMIDGAVYRLRKKLSHHVQYIETRTGQGFILHRARLIKGS